MGASDRPGRQARDSLRRRASMAEMVRAVERVYAELSQA
jgi:hypothetical protein